MSILFEVFNTHPIFFLSTIFIIGLLVGSFLNVVILRLPVMMEREWQQQCCELLELDEQKYKTQDKPFNLIKPRSRCPDCGHQISAIENIPVLSFLFLRGKCRGCGKKISSRYPLIEIASALSVTLVAFYFGVSLQTFFAMLLTWALIALSVIDFDHQLLPDDITLPLLWIGIIINLPGVFSEPGIFSDPKLLIHPGLFTHIESSILGAIFGYGSLWTVYMLFKLTTGKEGMGYGDFKLLAALGAWFGWQALPLIIVLSSLVGAFIGISLILFKSHNRNTAIPFGPYLAMAGWIYMLWGPYLMSLYLNAVI